MSGYDKIKWELLKKGAENLVQILEESKQFRESKEIKTLKDTCNKYKINPSDFKVDDALDVTEAASHGRDEFFSSVANKVVSKLMTEVKVPFLDLTIDDMEIKTKTKRGVKFSVQLGSKTIKPFIRVLSVINEVKSTLLKIKFKIDISTGLEDCQILTEKTETKISGKLYVKMKLSLDKGETPIGALDKDVVLGEKTFDVQLFDFTLPRK